LLQRADFCNVLFCFIGLYMQFEHRINLMVHLALGWDCFFGLAMQLQRSKKIKK